MFIRSKAEKKKASVSKANIPFIAFFLKTREYIIAIEPEGTESLV